MQGEITKQMSLYSQLYNEIDDNHLLKKVEKKIDLSFIEELIGDTYSKNYGRISHSPEVLFRLILVEYIYGYSDKKVIEAAKDDMAVKFFTTLNPEDELPSPTTISNFRTQRFKDIDLDKLVYITLKDLIDEGIVTLKKSYPKAEIQNTPVIEEEIIVPEEPQNVENEQIDVIEFREKQLDFFKDYTVNVLSSLGIDIYLPLNKTFKDISIHNFSYNEKEGYWVCSRNNKTVKTKVKAKKRFDGLKIYINYYFDKNICKDCIRKSKCIDKKFSNQKILTVCLDTRRR